MKNAEKITEKVAEKKLFDKVNLKQMELKNRLIRSATWEGIAAPDGGISENAYEIYGELAKGGVGAIITGFTSVALHDYYFEGMMRLCDDALIPQYKKMVDVIHAEGTPVIAQLALGAYYREQDGLFMQVEPDEMSEEEILCVIRQFIDAAIRAEKAGFDGVQIHAAHFFFLSRFISPAINHRTNAYGGSTEKRIIKEQVACGEEERMLPFPFMGWVECIAGTAYDWQFSCLLNNVHTAHDGDFS